MRGEEPVRDRASLRTMEVRRGYFMSQRGKS